MAMRVDQVLELLQKRKRVPRKDLNKLMNGGRNVTSLIQVLQKKGHVINTVYNEMQHPEVYEYVEYVKPFYIVARSIQRNYPELEARIRKEYEELASSDDK